jgi:hypothetical protein
MLPEIGLKQRFAELLDLLIDALAEIKEYCFYKHITLFEAFLFGLAFFSRFIWFSFFGVDSPPFDYYFSGAFWVSIFAIVTIIHLTGFYWGWLVARLAAMYAHAIIWLFMAILAFMSGTTAPAVPTFLLYTIFSLIVIVRLLREHKTQ